MQSYNDYLVKATKLLRVSKVFVPLVAMRYDGCLRKETSAVKLADVRRVDVLCFGAASAYKSYVGYSYHTRKFKFMFSRLTRLNIHIIFLH